MIHSHPSFSIDQARSQLCDSSKSLAHLTASMVYDDPQLMHLLVELALLDEKLYAQRASRVVSICAEKFPQLFKPHCSKVISALKNLSSEGAIRNFLKILSDVPLNLTKRDKTQLMNLCFEYLMESSSAIAIRVFSMQILYNLSLEIPEIGRELYLVLEEQLPESSPGYKSRARHIMKNLGG